MTADIVPWPNSKGGDGGGPEDPMLDKRVESLEQDVRDIRSTLQRFEILLVEIRASLLNCSTKDEINSLRAETAAIRSTMATRSEFEDLRRDTAKIREDGAYVRGRLENIPTFWQMFALISAMLIGIAGITFTAGKFFHP